MPFVKIKATSVFGDVEYFSKLLDENELKEIYIFNMENKEKTYLDFEFDDNFIEYENNKFECIFE